MSCILLVENDPEVLLLVDEVLRGAGYQIDTAEPFREADNLLALRVRLAAGYESVRQLH
jgi:CheY-like chemotaxis protein